MSEFKLLYPKDWVRFNSILNFYPKTLKDFEQDTSIPYYMKGGYSVRAQFKSGTSFAKVDKLAFVHKSSIPLLIDHILSHYKSIAHFISENHKDRTGAKPKNQTLNIELPDSIENSDLPFDPVPIGKLELPPKKNNPAIIEAYCRRRAIFALLEICVLVDPKMYWSNKVFLKTLSTNPQNKNSPFLQALRIEPCLLQTEVGRGILQEFSLWDRKEIDSLGTAIKPQKKAKIESTLTDNNILKSYFSKAMLIVTAIDPKVKKLKLRELFDLLQEHKNEYIHRNYNRQRFAKIKKQLIG